MDFARAITVNLVETVVSWFVSVYGNSDKRLQRRTDAILVSLPFTTENQPFANLMVLCIACYKVMDIYLHCILLYVNPQ